MKKIRITGRKVPSFWNKSLRLMKLTFLFLVIGLMQLSASVYSQTTMLSLELRNAKVAEVLDAIESQSEFRFAYSPGYIDLNRKVTVDIHDKTIDESLKVVFAGTNVEFGVFDRHILLYPESLSPATDAVVSHTTGAQQRTVSGKVTDSDKQPLPGVTVVIKGTTQGTVTNADGNYSLTNIPEGASLVFSFVGMKTQEIEVDGQSAIDVIMEVDAIGIEEVVAIGYGRVKKSDLTGAVSRADIGNLLETSNVSIIQALQGSVAGLNVGAVTSAGQNPIVSVRAQNTLSSASEDNAPLIILDGVIYRGSLVELNPADIESVDVLKDASSAAVYGSQASNGVILITSKHGRQDSKPIIEYNGSYSIETPTNALEPMRAAEYEKFFQDAYWEDGRLGPDYLQVNPSYVWQNNLKTREIQEGYEQGLDIPWWDLFTRDGLVNNHNLSVNGKADKVSYFFSGGITDQKAYLLNDDFKRYSFRVNLDVDITNWLKIGTQSFVTISDYSGVTAGTRDPFSLQPWAPIYDSEGEILAQPDGIRLNPFLTIAQDDADIRKNFFSNLYADIKLPVEGLSYRVNYSNNFRTRNLSRYNPSANSFRGQAQKTYAEYWDWTLDNILTYQLILNDAHNINATFLYGIEKLSQDAFTGQANNFIIDYLGYNRLQAGDPTLHNLTSNRETESSLYSMVRLLYNYKKKYYLTGTVRRDGFSGFGENNKIAVFPTLGLGWALSEEDFLQNISWIDFLKVRGSYGQAGRRGLGRYDTQAVVNSGTRYVFGDGGSSYQGQAISSLQNNELTWETTTGTNLGLDFTLFNSKLGGNVEYYNNKTENILYNIKLPRLSGFEDINTNIAEVSNHGLEFTLSGIVLHKNNWKWNGSVNYSSYRNKIESILGPQNDIDGDGKEDDLVASGLFIGEPQNVIYDYEIIGMWQLEDSENGSIWTGFYPGTYKLKDVDESGDISALADRQILGYIDPAYRFSLSNTISFKNFSLFVFINSIQGGKNYFYGNDSPNTASWTSLDQIAGSNVPKGGWDYWMPENPDAKYRRLDRTSAFGGTPYSQRNFVRLQDVSLSYTFPNVLNEAIGLRKLKVFVSGKNLATWTKWKGQDPETGVGFVAASPVLKSYTLGLNVQF